ncbi:TRAFAC clade GTPase domain-containing protein [Oscillibacter sp.]|uniref:TRAFAC clade GTPase domain-containing protein n=1 Tax=Oscillibacter sp. TaxID=1945593 RepID=UPI0028B13317|nr:hypothetical protein [Oscillibacter sp.]
MTESKSCFIMGLPAAGKTSYIAALAYSLQQKKIKTKLQWNTYSGNQQYLARLARTWLSVDSVARTSIVSQQENLSWTLRDNEENEYVVSFPDLSGETFQKQYADREIEHSLADYVAGSDGIIVFVNPKGINEPTLISELPLKLRLEADDDPNKKERSALNDDPTAVQLVQLLQDIAYLVEGRNIPIAVIVSAWDIVEKIYSSPELFVKEHLSLLWQYLETNKNIFLLSYFGVSAQGGELETPAQSEALIEQYVGNPEQRMYVVDNSGVKSHDLTVPLWELLNKQMGLMK